MRVIVSYKVKQYKDLTEVITCF